MLEGFDVVAFTYADWFATQSTPQHLMRLLARKNRVLFVDMPRSFLRPLRGVDPVMGTWKGPPLQTVAENIHVYHPRSHFLPVGHLPSGLALATLRANGRRLAHLLRGVCRQLRFDSPLLWNFSPLHGGAVPHLPCRLFVHDICDEWINYISYLSGRRAVDTMDCELARKADLVFVFSQHMYERRRHCNAETHIVLPAGDVDAYKSALLPETTVPAAIANLPRPVIGAICVVDKSRFDPELTLYLARQRPEWSIAIVGPIRPNFDARPLRSVPNIYLIEDTDRADLPGYLKGMDVAIVPYALNDATRGIYPMKLQEYLAGGKPVVSPPLPACLHLKDVIRFAGTHQEFLEAVEAGLRDQSPDRVAQRVGVAQQNTWAHRLEERVFHLERLLNR